MNFRRSRGFTLLELLMVLAIIAIVAAIAINNYLNAITRARQKRTMADMRTIAIAWESRAGETRAYSAAGAAFSMPAVPLAAGTLSGMLVPTYTRTLPRLDAWGGALQFHVDSAEGARSYSIRSAGRDGAFESGYVAGTTEHPNCDIVYSGGSFVVYPENTH
jgi:prepilin-type N-terminal cleavage/methylation domain-containing protein